MTLEAEFELVITEFETLFATVVDAHFINLIKSEALVAISGGTSGCEQNFDSSSRPR